MLRWIAAFLTCLSISDNLQAEVSVRPVLGYVEQVELSSAEPVRAIVAAKLDTGADFSSLSPVSMTEFDRSGVDWVRFVVRTREGTLVTFERPVVRAALIKRIGRKAERRPVVRLTLCLGATLLETEVNLVDRSSLEYPMLIGRSFLSGVAVIDPAIMYSTPPRCKAPGPKSETP